LHDEAREKSTNFRFVETSKLPPRLKVKLNPRAVAVPVFVGGSGLL
jgi:hypothetical protein